MNPEEEVALLKLKLAHLEDSLVAVEMSNTQFVTSLQEKSAKLSKAEDALSLARQKVLRLEANLDVAQKEISKAKAKASEDAGHLFAAKKNALEERYKASQEKKISEGMRHNLTYQVKKETLATLDGYLMALADIGDDGGKEYAEARHQYELQE